MKESVEIRDFKDLESIEGQKEREFILKDDINAQGKTLSSINIFEGILNGNGHIIKGLSGKENGIINTNIGVIKDLHIRSVEWSGEGVKSGYNCGVICDINGADGKEGKIINCSVGGELEEYNRVGSIANENRNGKIINCTSNCTIIDANLAGGIAAKNYDTISRCYSTCEIKNMQRTSGGIVGLNVKGLIESSCFNGNIKYTSEAGGIAARNQNQSRITFCHANPTLKGNWKSGVLAGHCVSSSIENSSYRFKKYRKRALTDYASNSLIKNCYWIADESGNKNIIDKIENGTKIENIDRASSLLEAKKKILIGSI